MYCGGSKVLGLGPPRTTGLSIGRLQTAQLIEHLDQVILVINQAESRGHTRCRDEHLACRRSLRLFESVISG